MIQINQYQLGDGREIVGYTLMTRSGMSVEILNLGGIIRSIRVPDRQGYVENVVLSFADLDSYITNPGYTNAIIGRMAGRIGGGEIFLDDQALALSRNEGSNQLHGGHIGLDKKIWKAEVVEEVTQTSLILKTESAHMEEGYPGNVQVTVTYTLTEDQKLHIQYEGFTDTKTVMNLTNHAYFNLSGDLKKKILDHQVTIRAHEFAAIGEGSIVTGECIQVEGTAFDFNTPMTIGARIEQDEPQLRLGNGYDHPWCLQPSDGRPQIMCYEPQSGRKLEVTTDQRAVVMYTMNYPIEALFAQGDHQVETTRLGVCFETQGLPLGYDGINQKQVMISPDQPYRQTTTWHFTCE